ncbi:MAG: hypothetical protein NTV86_11665 [Planctomycetota bacterium]|nr:hypothetical protein [Planctomycetota bacterium]
MTRTCKTITMAAVAMTAAVCFPMTAQAGHGHGGGGLAISLGGVFPIGNCAPAVQQVMVAPGHYEDQVQTVLVAKGHWEKVCIPAAQQMVTDRHGRTRLVTVVPEHKEKVWVPDRFETRTVRVWVPPVYQAQPVAACAPAPLLGGLSIGGRFHW